MINPLTHDIDYIIEQTHELWESIRGKVLFITGGTGFFGCWILETFTWANDKLGLGASALVLTRNPNTFRNKAPHLASHASVQLLKGDVCTFRLPFESIDFVIHAASPVDPKILGSNPIDVVDTIVNGTRNILEQVCNIGVKGFLYVSSGAVGRIQLPDVPQLPDVSNPTRIYGEAKRYAEFLCSVFRKIYGLHVVVARPFTFVGPYQNLEAGFAVTEFIKQALRGNPIYINGDGTPLRSYCYAADLSAALWHILLKGQPGGTYEVGSEEPLSILGLANMIVDLAETNSEIFVAQKTIPGQSPQRYIPDITRLKTDMGFCPKFKLQEGLAKTISWIREKGLDRKPIIS